MDNFIAKLVHEKTISVYAVKDQLIKQKGIKGRGSRNQWGWK